MKRVLLTGATGRIGANVAKLLVESGYHVIAVVRPDTHRAQKLASLDLELRPVDLRDRERLTACVSGIDAIVHLGVKLRGPTNYDHLDINLSPTLTLLEAVRQHCPNLERFVYGSSDTLFPHTGWMPEPIRYEQRFTWPVGMYAWSKLAGEAMVNSYFRQYGIPTVILNIPWTFCGREFLGQRTRSLSPLIEHHLDELERQPAGEARDRTVAELRAARAEGREWVVPLCPEGPPFKRHLGDVRDVAEAHRLALERDSAVGEAFVIMSRPFDFGVAVPHLAQISGQGYCRVVFPRAEYYEYDMTYAREKLGFVARYGPREMIEDAWRQARGEEIGVIDVGPEVEG
ncbi:MAG: NAD(P)-dependent oxidoreductase [Armatimonadetes bacterium]|nr:NAD(P)-dependent oxidoreductase [Armatimonadota bacterium]